MPALRIIAKLNLPDVGLPINREREMGLVKPEVTPGVSDSFHHIYGASLSRRPGVRKRRRGDQTCEDAKERTVSPNQAFSFGMSDT